MTRDELITRLREDIESGGASPAMKETLAAALAEISPLNTPSSLWRENGWADPHGDRYSCERASLIGGKQASVPTIDVTSVIREIAELPDRTSPDDQPDMMLVSEAELRAILLAHALDGAARVSPDREALARRLEEIHLSRNTQALYETCHEAAAALRLPAQAEVEADLLTIEEFLGDADNFELTDDSTVDIGPAFEALKRLRRLSSSVGEWRPTKAEQDVIIERRRQIDVEGWTADHDDEHPRGELAQAAAAYALHAGNDTLGGIRYEQSPRPAFWPWQSRWWKPKDRRRDLVRASALIIAEIERLDRLPPAPPQEKPT